MFAAAPPGTGSLTHTRGYRAPGERPSEGGGSVKSSPIGGPIDRSMGRVGRGPGDGYDHHEDGLDHLHPKESFTVTRLSSEVRVL